MRLTAQFCKNQNDQRPRVAHWINLIRTAVFGSRQRIPNVPRQGFRPLDPECPRSFATSGGPLPLPGGGRVTEEVISVDNAVSHTHPRPLTTLASPYKTLDTAAVRGGRRYSTRVVWRHELIASSCLLHRCTRSLTRYLRIIILKYYVHVQYYVLCTISTWNVIIILKSLWEIIFVEIRPYLSTTLVPQSIQRFCFSSRNSAYVL